MNKPKRYFLYLTVFITGATVLILEILGTRVFAPFYGSTIFVWSSLISVALGFLALGYWTGGRIADRHPRYSSFYLIIFFGGVVFIALLQYKKYIILFADLFGIQYGPLIAATLLFGPVFYLLGMASPYAIRLLAETVETTGGKSGSVFAFSTIGSLLGALAAGFVLIPLFSIDAIFVGLAIILGIVGIAGIKVSAPLSEIRHLISWRIVAALIGVGVLFLSGLFLKNLDWPKMTLPSHGVYVTETMYEDNNFYGDYRLVGVPRALDGVYCLLIDGANQGCVLPEDRSVDYNTGSPYAVVAFFLEQLPRDAEVLVLGAGAGEFFQYWAPDWLNYTVVDINPSTRDVFEAAGITLDPKKYTVVTDDARSYLRNNQKRYDAIWNDLFGNASPVTHMITQESFALAKSRLKPDGFLVTNVFGTTTGEDVLVNNVFATFKSVFSHVVAAPKNRDHFFTYIVTVGSEKELDAENISAAYHKRRNTEEDVWGPQNYYFFEPDEGMGTILTDAHNPAEYLWGQNVAAKETLATFRGKFKRLSAEDFR